MRIPSLSKIPKYRQFSYTPRFYDPVKEDLEHRRERIKAQIRNKENGNYRSNISYSFSRRSRENQQSNLRQFAIMVLLLATFFGYIYYDSIALYISSYKNILLYVLLIPVSVYLLFKIIKHTRRKHD